MQTFSLLSLLLLASSTSASVVINQTRVVYPSDSKSVAVQLLNSSHTLHLIQTWIDDGDPSAKPENIRVPFLVSPPVVKISGDGGQTLKITQNSAAKALPKDRETVFWLNVLDVPPMPADKQANYLQVALQSRIKLFWRPANLPISLNEIPDNVKLSDGKADKTCIDNQTPYYLTLVQIMRWDGKSIKTQKGTKDDNFLSKAIFIPPYTCQQSEYIRHTFTKGKYQFVRIDDFGSKTPFIVSY